MKAQARVYIIGSLLISVVGLATFLTAKFTAKSRTTKASTQAIIKQHSHKTDKKEPFAYKEIGHSIASDSVTHGGQRVAKYTVNVKTFTSRDDAEKMLDQLSSSGLMGYYTPMRQGDKIVYHVRLGIYSDESDAKKTLAQLHSKTKLQGLVTQLY